MDQLAKPGCLFLLALLLIGCGEPFEAETKAVRNALEDPESARFKELRRGSLKGSVCGKVNAKNAYGGYSGFVGFSVHNGVLYFGSSEHCPRAPSAEVIARMRDEELGQAKKNLDESMKCMKEALEALSTYSSICLDDN